MKNTILISLILAGINFAQSFDWCLDSLYSENFGQKVLAIECVNHFEPEGAVDVLVERIDDQQPYLQIQFLNTLYNLDYEDVSMLAHELIYRADNFANYPEYPWDPLDAKVSATAILVYKGDYSTIEYVFEQLNQDNITINDALSLDLLSLIMKNVPDYRDVAKSILLNELDNSSEEIRYFVLLYLAEEFGEEMNDELVHKFENDSDLPTRTLALQYLSINNYSGLNLLLKQQLELEEEYTLRIKIADSLLIRFGEPSDLKTVIDYQPNEPDETARWLMGFAIEEFIPPKPGGLGYTDLATRLISYNDEMFEYEWIQNEEKKYYFKKLNAVNEALVDKKSEEACAIINDQILPQSEQDLKDQLITKEGYKFLHYYTIYIREKIEEEFGNCN